MTKFSTDGIKAGDPIYVATPGSWEVRIEKKVATHVTPKGFVVRKWGTKGEYEDRFNPAGAEVGGSTRYGKLLVTRERYEEYVAEQARKAAERSLRDHLALISKAPLSEVRQLLAEAQRQLEALAA